MAKAEILEIPELPLKNLGQLDTGKIKFGVKYKLTIDQQFFLIKNSIVFNVNVFKEDIDVFIEYSKYSIEPLICFQKKKLSELNDAPENQNMD